MKNLYITILIIALSSTQSLFAGTYQDVVTILETNCTFSSCHDSDNPVSGLDFTAPDANIHAQLVNANPQNSMAAAAGLKLVDPGYPQRSYLYQKINYGLHADSALDPSMGGGMPTGGNAMDPEDIELVRQWIYYGAKSNNSTDIDPSTLSDYYNGDGLDPITPLDPPPADEGFQLHFGQMFLEPGDEQEIIYRYDLGNTEDLEITRIEVAMNSESHHFLFFSFEEGAENNQSQGILPSGFNAITTDTKMIGGWAYSTDYELPGGTAFKWPAEATLKFNYHILNYSSTGVLPAEIYVNIYTQPAGTAVMEMQSDFFLDDPFNLIIPPGVQTFDWTLPINFLSNDSVHVWTLGSHTHALGTRFDIYAWNQESGVGDQVYDGFYNLDYTQYLGFYSYDEPAFRTFDDFLSLGPNEGLHMEAEYNNNTGSLVTFGLTTEDEMFGIFTQYLIGDISQLPGPEDSVEVSIQDTDLASWNIKPNPAHNYVQISTEGLYTVTIYDAIGKVVMNTTEVNNELNLNTSEWKAGVYFVQIGSGDFDSAQTVQTKKLIISH